MTGKERCELLRNIRRNIAEKNNLDYELHECSFEGDCTGYCPVCDAESAYLMEQLEKREALGEKIIIDTESIEVLHRMSKLNEGMNINDFTEIEHQLTGDLHIEEPGYIESSNMFNYDGVWAVEAAIKRGVPIEEACRQHGFTVAEWEELYEEVKYRPEEYYYALNVVSTFVEERLDGDVNRLKEFDLSSIYDDPYFGNCNNPYGYGKFNTKLLTAIASLVFENAWPELSYKNANSNLFHIVEINVWYNHFDAVIGYFGKCKVYHVPEELDLRMKRFAERYYTIGNVMILPIGLQLLHGSIKFGRGYPDIFFNQFYKMMVRDKHCDFRMLDAMHMKGKELNEFRTKESFSRVMRGLMLESLLDDNNEPRLIFDNFSVYDRDCNREEYIRQLTRFLDFAEKIMDYRSERIINVLKRKLNLYNKADSGAVNSDFSNNSRYFKNQGAAAVVREDFSGKRYIKTSDDIHERPVSKECKEAWGIPSFGTFNELLPISKEDYDSFGVYWYWSDKTGEIVYRKEYDSYISRQRKLEYKLQIGDEVKTFNDISYVLNHKVLKGLMGDDNQNVLVSPYRIQVVLTLLAKWADDKLREKILSMLCGGRLSFKKIYCNTPILISDKSSKIETSTILWLQNDLKYNREAIDGISYYLTFFGIEYVDFSSPDIRQVVNEKIDHLTHGLIKTIDLEISDLTKLLLTDVLYFKACWQDQFDTFDTRKLLFYGTKGKVKVPMMNMTSVFRHCSLRYSQIVELPYQSEFYFLNMRIILPEKNSTMAQTLDEIQHLDCFLNMENMYINLTMPKFSMTKDNDLTDVMKSLGLDSIVTEEDVMPRLVADMNIGHIKQKLRVDVDENGTEAAAVTYMDCVGRNPYNEWPDPLIIKVNRPFIFEIVELSTHQILFSGIINNVTE